MRKKREYLIFAWSFIIIIGVLGIVADINFYRFKTLGIMSSNYEFDNSSTGNAAMDYAVNFPLKTEFVDFNGMIRRVLDQHEMNNVVKLNNGYLAIMNKRADEETANENADAVIKFADYCKSRNAKFIYVQVPYKVSKYDTELPAGEYDYTNENMDGILTRLTASGIQTIDLRQEMHDHGMNQYDFYYKTDHHWNTEGAFWAYTLISKWIVQNTGCEIDEKTLDINNYEIIKYKKWHLGSYGQRTGKYYAGIDDYDLILPKFDTKYKDSSTGKIQSFSDTFVNWDTFNNRNPESRYTYDQAISKGSGECLLVKNNLRILFVSDSYSTAVRPYMSICFKTVDSVYWPDGLKSAYIDEFKPDIVIVMPFAADFEDQTINYIR